MTEPWYTIVDADAPLTQGDLILDCPLIAWKSDPVEFSSDSKAEVLKGATTAVRTDVVVMTQVCDLEHEKVVTGLINNLVDIARREKDHATEIFLQWFVTEQVEEEANATDIIQKFKLMGNDGNGLFMIDNELGSRVYTPPSPLQAKA